MNKYLMNLFNDAIFDEAVSLIKKNPPKKGFVKLPITDLIYLKSKINNRILKRLS